MSDPAVTTALSLAEEAVLLAPLPRRRLAGMSGAEVFSFAFLILLVAAVLFADAMPGLMSPNFPYGDFSQPPDLSLNGILGTDPLGRSTLSRIIYGARATLTIVCIATAISLTLGMLIGMLAGFYRGFLERLVDLFANTVASLPPILVLLALITATGPSVTTLTLTLGFLEIGTYARISKGGVISQNDRDYVLAARALGASDLRIMMREILPNLFPTLAALMPPLMAGLIITEGSLSFLGYGIAAPAPSWGGMIADSTDLLSRFPLLMVGPILAIVLTVYSLNTAGDYLAHRIDTRERQL
jgi:peptide/nickel transport system permease protein